MGNESDCGDGTGGDRMRNIKIRYASPILEAIRYGTNEAGEWYDGAVQHLAQFVKETQPDTVLTDGQICDVLQPSGLWNPPENAELYLMFGNGDHVSPIHLGDWVVRQEGNTYRVCSDVKFHDNYEFVKEES